jgi:IPT/TIG domain
MIRSISGSGGSSGGATIAAASLLIATGAATTVLTLAALPDGVSVVDIYARASTAGDIAVWARKRSCVVRRTAGGNVSIIGASADPDAISEGATSAFAAAFVASGTSLLVQCTGAAYWSVTAQVLGANNPNAAPPGPLPDVVSILPTSGPTAGGTSVVITGTDFTGATAVTFGGVAAASFTVDSSTQITAVTPALTAGAKDVSVTTPYGTDTLVGAFTASAFTLAGLAWELWLKGSSRTSSQVTGTASAGGSGGASRKLTSTSANAIAAGATFNALPSIDWNSDDMWSSGGFVLSDIVAAGGNEFTCIMVIQVNSYTATGTAFHDVPRIFATGGGGAYFGIGAHNDGTSGKLVVGLYDGAFKTHKATLATATKQVVAMRLTSAGVLGIKVGAAAWVNLTGVGAITSLTNYMNTFSAASPGKVDCDIAEFLFAKVAHSDGDVSSAQTALATTYGITL